MVLVSDFTLNIYLTETMS